MGVLEVKATALGKSTALYEISNSNVDTIRMDGRLTYTMYNLKLRDFDILFWRLPNFLGVGGL